MSTKTHNLRLTIDTIGEDDVRKAYIRINEDNRDNIDYESLVGLRLKGEKKWVYRIMLGTTKIDTIRMDETTRLKLGINKSKLGDWADLEVAEFSCLSDILPRIQYARNHPDPSYRISIKIAFWLGFFSIVLSALITILAAIFFKS